MPFDGPDGFDMVCQAAAVAVRPKIPLWPSEWADQRRRLSPKSSAEPGPWRTSRVPYTKAVMDALDLRFPAWMVVFMKSSQVAASECGLNWLGHTIDEDPASMLALFPGEKLGKRWMRKRVEPMISASPTLLKKVPLGRHSEEGNTLLEKHFPDGVLSVGSANVAIDMASDAYAKLLLDEVDRFMKEVEGEGDPIEIVLRRISTFAARKKVFINSSPTIEALSHINPWWKSSSQGHFHVPCPHCGEFQPLEWENMKWTSGKPREAQYMCVSCAALIAEHHKTEMLEAGEWRHGFAERVEDIIGFHVNCLYTPIGLGDSWAENAAAWERAKGDTAKVKVFTNTRLGETHEDPNEKLEWETLKNRAEPLRLREVPNGVLLMTCGGDVQKDRVELQVLGWSRGEQATTIDYQVIPGDPTRDELWEEVDEYLALELANTFGVKMRLSCTLIDSNYLTDDVLKFTRKRRSRNIFASRGSNILTKQAIGRPTHPDVKFRGLPDRRGAERYEIGVGNLKRTLHEHLRADANVEIGARHVHFSDKLSDDYFKGIASEVFDPHKRKWVKVYENNEPLDTFLLAMAAAMHHSVRVDRMDELSWQRLEQLYQPAAGAPKPKAHETVMMDGLPIVSAFVQPN